MKKTFWLLLLFPIIYSCNQDKFSDLKVLGLKGNVKSMETFVYSEFSLENGTYSIDSIQKSKRAQKYQFDKNGLASQLKFSVYTRKIHYTDNKKIINNYTKDLLQYSDTLTIIYQKDRTIFKRDKNNRIEYLNSGESINIDGHVIGKSINTDSTVIRTVHKDNILYFESIEEKIEFDNDGNPTLSIIRPVYVLKDTLQNADGSALISFYPLEKTLIKYKYEYYK